MVMNMVGRLGLVVVGFAFACISYAEEGGRLLVDVHPSRAEKIIAVLARPEVQVDIHLRHDQMAQIDKMFQQPMKTIPGVSNLLDRTASGSGCADGRNVEELFSTLDAYHLLSLSNILTAVQIQRLQEILLQVDGLKSLRDVSFSASLELTASQKDDLKDVFGSYESLLSHLYKRLLRQQIAGLRGDETIEARNEEVRSLVRVITAIEKDRDRDLEAILTDVQKQQWSNLLGSPLNIQWPEMGKGECGH